MSLEPTMRQPDSGTRRPSRCTGRCGLRGAPWFMNGEQVQEILGFNKRGDEYDDENCSVPSTCSCTCFAKPTIS
jgi:hypothetical protein